MPLLPLITPNLLNPIFRNLVDVDFGNDILNEDCFKIKNNIAYINNFYDNQFNISTSQIIQSLINITLSKVVFKFHDKNGKVLEQIYIFDFKFTKIINLLDYNLGKDSLKTLKVKFKYSKSFHSEKEYKSYIRKKKLNKINGQKS